MRHPQEPATQTGRKRSVSAAGVGVGVRSGELQANRGDCRPAGSQWEKPGEGPPL